MMLAQGRPRGDLGRHDGAITLEMLERRTEAVTKIHLTNKSSVPGIEKAAFDEIAAKAKAGCPISRLLAAAAITLDATLE